MDTTAPTAIAELRHGWRPLIGAALGHATGVHSLVFYTAGIFIAALHADLGWSRSALSVGPTLLVAGLALASPVTGALADRRGEARVLFPGFVTLALGLLGMAALAGTLALYYALMAAMAIFAAGTATPTYTRIVSRTFERARGTALGLTITGTALTSTFVPSILQRIIDAHGWRVGYLALAAVVAVITPVIFACLRDGSRPAPAAEASTAFGYRQLASDPVFRCLALALFTSALAAAGLLVHFVPMLVDEGLSATDAAFYAGVIGATLLFSRLLTGMLVDRIFAPFVAVLVMGLSAAGFLIFASGGTRFVVIGAIATGLCFGAESDLMAYLTARYYDLDVFGRVFGALYPIYLAGVALSPIAYGVGADAFHGYAAAIAAAGALLAVSALCFARLPAFPERIAPRAR